MAESRSGISRLRRYGSAVVGARPIMLTSAMLLILMLLMCLLSLPYTLGRVAIEREAAVDAPTGQPITVRGPRRYEFSEIDLALLPPFWAKHRADERERLRAFAAEHGRAPRFLLGTDALGRDVFIRLLVGGAVSLTIGLAAAGITVLIGTVCGMLAGWVGGRIDALLMRTVDILFGLPTILLVVLFAVAVEGLIERSGMAISPEQRTVIMLITLLVAIGGVSWLTMARVTRGQVLSLKRQPFMESCVAIGVPTHRQVTRHLLPNLLGPIIVYATLAVPTAILSESFLSFLGIGVREPLPSWGNLAADGLNELNVVRSRWWLLLWPCVMLALTLLALNFLGEGLREKWDVRRTTTPARTA
jgi:oligopeptide transport system permease protein